MNYYYYYYLLSYLINKFIYLFNSLLNGSVYVHAVVYIDFAQYLVHVGVYIASAHCLFTRSRVLDRKNSMYTIALMLLYFITAPKPLFLFSGSRLDRQWFLRLTNSSLIWGKRGLPYPLPYLQN